jgi:hypothetical protein
MSASPYATGKLMANAGWHIQAAMHERILDAIDPKGAGRRKFYYVAQENEAPYALTVNQIGEAALTIGRKQVDYAVSHLGLLHAPQDVAGLPEPHHPPRAPDLGRKLMARPRDRRSIRERSVPHFCRLTHDLSICARQAGTGFAPHRARRRLRQRQDLQRAPARPRHVARRQDRLHRHRGAPRPALCRAVRVPAFGHAPAIHPARFIEGIQAAEAAGAEVVIIDSFSHEYDGVGGIMDWADRLASEGVKSPGNWKEPKGAHKKLMNALLQCRASIIFCLRADEKIEILRENNKTVVRPLGWMPICEKRFMFEMTASFTLTPDRPGIPHFDLPHKLQQQHRSMFSDREPIGEESGRLLATWASGGSGPRCTEHQPRGVGPLTN